MKAWETYISHKKELSCGHQAVVSSLSQPIIDVFAGFSETYPALFLVQGVLSSPHYTTCQGSRKQNRKKQKICCRVSKLPRRGNAEVDDQGTTWLLLFHVTALRQ